MRIQITDDEGTVLHVPVLNKDLEQDLFALFPTHSRIHVLRNRRTKHSVKTIEEAVWKLRQETRFA